jgi:DNA-binding transcriptional ArsR family regulator
VSDPGSLRALAHPARLRILSLLTGTALTTAEVARELGLSHANASYHVRVLRDAGELVVAGEETIRGGRAVRYRHPWREDDRPAAASVARPTDPGAAELVVQAATGELRRRYRSRRRDLPGIVTDAELWVDPDTWAQARELLARATELVHDGARPPRAEGAVLVNLSLFGFAMDPS